MKSASIKRKVLNWNRKLHIWCGLFLILFLGVFSVSGLLLNHSAWKLTSFWDQRKISEISASVIIPDLSDNNSMVSEFMDQLDIQGEVSNIKTASGSIDFRVTVPGTIRDVHVDFADKLSLQKLTKYNLWGKLRTLHTFNGANKSDPGIRPGWIVTRIWLLTMDAIAIGMIFLSLSGWIMWYEVTIDPNRRQPKGFIE
jgi:hypothetical protein